ncbi:MAG TPA: SOS response-associated peptidase [Chlorobiota bacterium]|nr:SOS response-associated peptidase [Chlorobiota bacterium]
MCYTVSIFSSTHVVETDIGAVFDDASEYMPYVHVSGFVHPRLPFVTNERPDALEVVEWGLIPRWTKSAEAAGELRDMTLNARAETIRTKPSFREAIVKRRGLLPVNGFVEWRHEGTIKHPYFVRMREAELFTLGCIWEDWTDRDSGELRRTFSIVTTEANGLMSWIHNAKQRMPAIITKGDRKTWLSDSDPEIIDHLLRPLEDGTLTAYPLSREMSRVKVNTDHPELLAAIGDTIVEP